MKRPLLTFSEPFSASIYPLNNGVTVAVIPTKETVNVDVFVNGVLEERWEKLSGNQQSALYAESFIASCSNNIRLEMN